MKFKTSRLLKINYPFSIVKYSHKISIVTMKYWQKGDKLQDGKYIIEKILGSGDFGITYKATKYRKNETEFVVIKTLNRAIQNRPDFLKHQENFVDEAFKLKAFKHPHIVKINKLFREKDLWCIDMEYIEGETLGEHLKKYRKIHKQGLPEEEALNYIKQIGEALIEVHEEGFIHRDINPYNIMLREGTQEAVLIDFGSAREFVQDETAVHTSIINEEYAPIEQYKKNAKRGAYTDVYALAATLYQLLTAANIMPAKFRKKGTVLIPPKQHNPNIRNYINDAIMKGMELYPENRPQTMKEWLDLLSTRTPTLIPTPLTRTLAQTEDLGNEANYLPPTIILAAPETPQKPQSYDINRRKFLKWGGLSVAGLITTLFIGNTLHKNSSQSLKIPQTVTPTPNPSPTPISPPTSTSTSPLLTFQLSLENFNFETVQVNNKGEIIKRENKEAQYRTYHLGNGITIEFVYIPGGRFLMGNPPTEKGYHKSQSPQHVVYVPSFFMGKYPVTQAQWEEVMGDNPSFFKGANRPVEKVSWDDSVAFCEKVSKIILKQCQLPSEAQWEYACRAGTTTPFYFGETITTDLANYYGQSVYANEPKGISRGETTDVGIFPANGFGLNDLHGNVWEWCADTYHNSYEGAPTDGSAWVDDSENNFRTLVARGGSWISSPRFCRSGNRDGLSRNNRTSFVGFRACLPLKS